MSAAASTGATLHSLLEHVEANALRYFPNSAPIASVRARKTVRRAYSTVHWISVQPVAGATHDIVVKVGPGTETQHAALQSLWPAFAGQDAFTVPRPLDYLPDASALVMAEARGRPLVGVVAAALWRPWKAASAAAACTLVGEWLRFYHDLRPSPVLPPFDADHGRRDVPEALRELRDRGFPERVLQRLEGAIDHLAGRAHGAPVRASHIHGDFKIDNVLVQTGAVAVLDVWAVRHGAIERDLASFLNSLALVRLWRPGLPRVLARLEQAFLSGYFGKPVDDPVIPFLRSLGLLDLLLEIMIRRPSPLVRRRLQYFAAEYARRLEGGGRVTAPGTDSARPSPTEGTP